MNVLHLAAKWIVIVLKNDEVIGFLTWPNSDFSALKNVRAETDILLSKPVTSLLPMTSHSRFAKQ